MGRGKAFFQLRKGLKEHHVETLRWAATRWCGYDRMFSGGYGQYVAYLLREAGLEERAISWIEDETPDDSRDSNHRAQLLAALSSVGHCRAGAVLRNWVSTGPWIEGSEVYSWLIRVDGVAGLEQVARKALSASRALDIWEVRSLVEDAEIRVGKREVAQFLSGGGEEARFWKTLLQEAHHHRKERSKPPPKTWEEARAALDRSYRPGVSLGIEGWIPSKTDLDAASDYLLSQTNPRVVQNVGRRIGQMFPRPERLAEAALASQGNLRRAFLVSLVLASKPLARAVGRRLVREGDFVNGSEALGAIAESADADLLAAHLPRNARGVEVLHKIGSNLLKVKVDSPARTTLLRWTYDRTPCSFCRSGAVIELAADRALSKRALHECLYDCEPDTRRLARRALRTSEGVPV